VNLTALINGLVAPGIAGDTEMLTSVSAALGTAVLGANNTVSYTAPATALDTLTFTVADQYGDSATGKVADTVDAGPTAGSAHLYIAPGQSLDLTNSLLALDTPGLPGDTLSLTAVGTSGTTGTVTLSKGDLSYTAPAGGSADIFTYTVSDQLGDSATGSVNVTLDSSLLKNDNITLSGSGIIIDGMSGKNIDVSLTGGNNTVLLGDGNDQVTLSGNGSLVSVGGGNDQLSVMGNNDTATAGNGNENLTVTGNNDHFTIGNGNDDVTVNGTGESITAGTGNDTFSLGASTASLVLHGQHDTVSVNGGRDTITDTPNSTDALSLQVGALGGTVTVGNFSVAKGVVMLADALASAELWMTPAQVTAAVRSDNHGGSLLSFGASGSIDFLSVSPNELHASNFHIGS